MKQRAIALTLTLTLLLAAAVSAFAVEPAANSEDTVPTAETLQRTETGTETAVSEDAAAEDAAIDAVAEEPEPEVTDTLLIAPAPAPAGKKVSFYELEKLVTKNNLTYQTLSATIEYMEELEKTEDTLTSSIQQLTGAIAALDPTAPDYAVKAAYLEGKLAELIYDRV